MIKLSYRIEVENPFGQVVEGTCEMTYHPSEVKGCTFLDEISRRKIIDEVTDSGGWVLSLCPLSEC